MCRLGLTGIILLLGLASCNVCGQKNQTDYCHPELISSYSGTIENMITVSFNNPPFDDEKLADKLRKQSHFEVCGVSVAVSDISISDHTQQREQLEALFIEHPNALKKLEILWKKYDTIKKDKLHFLHIEQVDWIISDKIAEEYLKDGSPNDFDMKDRLSQRFLQVVNESSSNDIQVENWGREYESWSTKETDRVMSDLEKLAKDYLEVFEQTMFKLFPVDRGCFTSNVNVARFCGSKEGCKASIKGFFSSYAQDDFYGIVQSRSRKDDKKIVAGLIDEGITQATASGKVATKVVGCQCTDITGCLVEVDIPGGNVLVSDSFVLIGRDELETKYLNTTDSDVRLRLAQMKLNPKSKTLEGDVSNWLKENFCSDRHLVWVGTRDSQVRYHAGRTNVEGDAKGYCPMYHIDVFLSLFGPIGKNSDSIAIMVARPEKEWGIHVTPVDAIRQNAYNMIDTDINDHIDKAISMMVKEVHDSTGVILKPVYVPLPFLLKYPFDPNNHSKSAWLDNIFSPTNGFVENVNGDVTYYMPFYEGTYKNLDTNKYQNVVDEIERRLKVAGVRRVKIIKDEYGPRSGLHCAAKVLNRK